MKYSERFSFCIRAEQPAIKHYHCSSPTLPGNCYVIPERRGSFAGLEYFQRVRTAYYSASAVFL